MKAVKDFSVDNLNEDEQIALMAELKSCIVGDGVGSSERAAEAIPLMEQAGNLPLLILLKTLPHDVAMALTEREEFAEVVTRMLKIVKEDAELYEKANAKVKETKEADG